MVKREYIGEDDATWHGMGELSYDKEQRLSAKICQYLSLTMQIKSLERWLRSESAGTGGLTDLRSAIWSF